MTEHPVETEEQFLGNASYVAPRVIQPAVMLPTAPLQHYAPNAHRLTVLDTVAKRDIQDAISERAAFLRQANPSIGTAVSEHALLDELAADLPAAEATFIERTKESDLWLDAEEQATRALAEIQDGNINAGIACLQAALAFAQNYRHSLTEERAR